MRTTATAITITLTIVLASAAANAITWDPLGGASYREVIARTAGMVRDADAQALARQYGLQILNVTWEDTGRYKGSCVGPNISDMTIQVQELDPRTEKYRLTCMPVIRYPNFSDKTGDLSLDKFYLLVGNEEGGELRRVTLRAFLGNLREYLSQPSSWEGRRTSLLAKRDTHVLVSAQACFLPIPKSGSAQFNPVLFNYQSYEGDPAVLTILATREGTSVTIIDNKRDAFQAGWSWGQRLFFNQNGERASLTGERLSDFLANGPDGGSTGGSDEPRDGDEEGLNMVLLVQVPLKQKNPMRFKGGLLECDAMTCAPGAAKEQRSDVEAAVIGHGEVEGPFTEIDHLAIERDERFPIRVTVQFYKATSNGVVSPEDMRQIAAQIDKVYAHADYVGSLVIEGDTGRPTEYDGDKTQPPGWWDSFWRRHRRDTGQSRSDAWDTLSRLLYGGRRPLCLR